MPRLSSPSVLTTRKATKHFMTCGFVRFAPTAFVFALMLRPAVVEAQITCGDWKCTGTSRPIESSGGSGKESVTPEERARRNEARQEERWRKEAERNNARHARAYNNARGHFVAGRFQQALRHLLEANAHVSGDRETLEMITKTRAELALAAGDVAAALAFAEQAQEESLTWDILDRRWGERLRAAANNALAREEKTRLTARDRELSAAIERDVRAIRRLGFDRRAEDFAEWEMLAAEAKAQFETEVLDAATAIIADKITNRVLESFSRFDAAKASRWIGMLDNVDPRPTEVIRLIRKVGDIPNKGDAVEDAKMIVAFIERLQQGGAAQHREDLLLLGMDLMCDVVPPPGDASCNAFKTVGKLTVASLYNNVARRVAVKEVEQLTTLTEAQLRALAKINELMTRHVQERNDVRVRLKHFGLAFEN